MTSSAIPARLLFQCGHAALVTLPRVKGENSAQRTERVAREKSDALARQCDFCGPAVEVGIQTNGSHLPVAEVLAAEPVVVAEPVVSMVEPVVATVEPVVVIEEPVSVVDEAVVVVDELVTEEEELALLAGIEEPVVIVEEPVIVVEEQPVIVVELVEEIVRRPRRSRRAAKQRQRFAVEYLAERVLRATDIHDALRQATALGASEILGIEHVD